MTEPIHKPSPPNPVPEEDLNLHEDFSPAIAENGRIRQLPPDEVPENAFAWMDDPSTRLDIVQDLVKIRQAEKAEEQARQEQIEKKQAEKANEQALREQPKKEETDLNPAPSGAQAATESFPLQGETKQEDPVAISLPPEGEGRGRKPRDEGENTRKTAEEANQLPAVQAPAENLPAIPTVTQTLPALPVLAAAGKTTRLSKTRRKKRKKDKTVRMPAIDKADSAAAAGGPPHPPQTPPAPVRSKRRRWGWIAAILLVGFLMTVGGVVPVENIPLLRNLAYAMGFSKTDTQRISFLRALLSWTDKTLGLNGKLSPWPAADTLLADGMSFPSVDADKNNPEIIAGRNSQLARAAGDTRLIDMRALNDLQRKQGRALDGISGTVLPEPGREEADLDAVLRDDQVTARTEANRDTGEVFFGSDTSAVNRHFQDGFDSSKMLTKIKNPYITDGHPIDWTQRTARQLLNGPGGLGGLNKELQYGAAAWAIPDTEMGETKPHKDLYHAWITSRMSKYTTNIWLKKSLAGSTFLNAQIPETASTGLQSGGIFIDSESLQEDQQGWKEYLEFEEKCRQELTQGGGQEVSEAVSKFNNLFSSRRGGSRPNVDHTYNMGFPNTCSEMQQLKNNGVDYTKFAQDSGLDQIAQLCKDAQKGYNKLVHICRMEIYNLASSCKAEVNYQSTWDSFSQSCADYCPALCKNAQDPAACEQNCKNTLLPNYNPGGSVTFFEDKVLDDFGGGTNYFPKMLRGFKDKEGTIRYGEKEEQDKEDENLRKTVRAGLSINSANFGN